MTNNLIQRARDFAHQAHDSIGQKRKYHFAPYWVHTDEVAEIVARVAGVMPEQVAGAHLHDVLEDVFPINPVFSPDRIREEFGEVVYGIVFDLTDQYTKENYPQFNRKVRKQKERERLGLTSPESQTVKLADLISNTRDIVKHDPDFAKVYIAEKQALLPHLVSGNIFLWVEAVEQAAEAAKFLKM